MDAYVVSLQQRSPRTDRRWPATVSPPWLRGETTDHLDSPVLIRQFGEPQEAREFFFHTNKNKKKKSQSVSLKVR